MQHNLQTPKFQDEANDRKHIFLWLLSDNANDEVDESLLNNDPERSSLTNLVKMNENGIWSGKYFLKMQLNFKDFFKK